MYLLEADGSVIKPLSKSDSRSGLGYLLVLAATVIWSWNFIVARYLAHSVPPVTLAFLRWLTAVLLLLPFAWSMLWRDRKLVVQHLPYLAAAGFLGVTMFNTLVYIAGHTTKAVHMALVAISSPIFIVICARIFLGEALTARRILGVLTATIGVLLLITHGDLAALLGLTFSVGDVWMLIAAVIFAGYSILVRFKPVELNQTVFLCSSFIIGLVFMLPWLGWELSQHQTMILSKDVIAAILYLGVGPSVVSYYCWNGAIATIGPARAAFVYYTLPLFSGIEASLVLQEQIRWIHFASGLLIVAGIIVATRETPDQSIPPD